MSLERTAQTPGDGNLQMNARGRVYSTEESKADGEVQVADLRSCTFNALVILSLCMGDGASKPKVEPIAPATVTITIGPDPKKKQ